MNDGARYFPPYGFPKRQRVSLMSLAEGSVNSKKKQHLISYIPDDMLLIYPWMPGSWGEKIAVATDLVPNNLQHMISTGRNRPVSMLLKTAPTNLDPWGHPDKNKRLGLTGKVA